MQSWVAEKKGLLLLAVQFYVMVLGLPVKHGNRT